MAGTLDKFGGERAHAKRLRGFLHDCTGSTPSEEADRVREALVLLADVTGMYPRGHARIEAMLACDAATSAVLEVLGGEPNFMLSRGEGDSCLATVVPLDGEEVIAEGTTPALALLAAHVAGVLARIERTAPMLEVPLAPVSMMLH